MHRETWNLDVFTMEFIYLRGITLLAWISLTSGRHRCHVFERNSTEPVDSIWCETGCCGTKFDAHCCEVQSKSRIVEGVLGALGGFFVLLVIIVTICCIRAHYRKTNSIHISTISIRPRSMSGLKSNTTSANS